MDFRPLNSCVLRKVHQLPKVDETLALLTGARIFSKLDTNSGFWQISLSEQLKLLTTFITPTNGIVSTKCHLEYAVHQSTYRNA